MVRRAAPMVQQGADVVREGKGIVLALDLVLGA
jgi:hypothetical protein